MYRPTENYFATKKRSRSLRTVAREAKIALRTFGYNGHEIIDIEGDWKSLINEHLYHIDKLVKLNKVLEAITFNVNKIYFSHGIDLDAQEALEEALNKFNSFCSCNSLTAVPRLAIKYKRSLDKEFHRFLNLSEDKFYALKNASRSLMKILDVEFSPKAIQIRDLKNQYEIVKKFDIEIEERFFSYLSTFDGMQGKKMLYYCIPNRKKPTTLFPFSPLQRHPKRNRQAELDKKRTRQTSFNINGSQIPSVEKSRLKVIEKLLQKQNSLNSYMRIFSKVLKKFKNVEIDETTNQEVLERIKNELANCLKKFNSTSFSKVLEKFDEKNHRLEGKLNILFRETTKFLRQIEDMAPDSMRNTFKVKILRITNIDRELNRIFHNYLSLMNSTDIAKLDRIYQKTLLELKKRNALEEEYGILAGSERSSEEEYEVLAGSERSSEISYELV